ncbi:MAG: CRISPR-associated endonuclease Cas1 [Moraxella sp.]|nr:CRISPR-associated endonuclease Cas1 [Moraxella sp.]
MAKTLIIDQKGACLDTERNLLIVSHHSFNRPVSIPFGQIGAIMIGSNVNLASTLLTKLAKHGVALTVLPTHHAGQMCRLVGDFGGNVSRRIYQHKLHQDDDVRRYWATCVVRLKIYRQAKLLGRIADHVGQVSKTPKETIDKLTNTYQHITPISLDGLRGIEGSSAQQFFGAYQAFFDDKWGFYARNRRPPKDPINVLLSLGYTLMTQLYEQSLYAVSLDPFLGVLHDESHGRRSLACDFAEFGRADIEWWVWQLAHGGELTLDMFDFGDDKPCVMNKAGRAVFYKSWAKLKPKLQKQAHRHVHTFLRRLTKTEQKLVFI